MHHRQALFAAAAAALLLAGCATRGSAPERPAVTIVRTALGVAHINAPDMHTLAYGVAYAHAQDNVCQTAQQLATVRGERARSLGNTRRPSSAVAVPPNQRARSPRTVASCCAVWHTLSCAWA